MDSVTHALAASSLFLALGHPELVPFAALGSVSMDFDVLLMWFPERNPKHYVFTHGGFTHSIAGSLIIGSIVFAAVAALTLAGPAAWLFGAGLGLPGLLALLMGSLTHVFCDFLAYPGIPVLFPFTDRKYTLGIFAGPSFFLLVRELDLPRGPPPLPRDRCRIPGLGDDLPRIRRVKGPPQGLPRHDHGGGDHPHEEPPQVVRDPG